MRSIWTLSASALGCLFFGIQGAGAADISRQNSPSYDYSFQIRNICPVKVTYNIIYKPVGSSEWMSVGFQGFGYGESSPRFYTSEANYYVRAYALENWIPIHPKLIWGRVDYELNSEDVASYLEFNMGPSPVNVVHQDLTCEVEHSDD